MSKTPKIPERSDDPTQLANVAQKDIEKLNQTLAELQPQIDAAEAAGQSYLITPAGHLRVDL